MVWLEGWYHRHMTNSNPTDPENIRPGPIRNESLSPDLLELIRAVYDVVGRYLSTTLEDFEIGFLRDTSPQEEVAVWCSITAAWIAYHEKHIGNALLTDSVEKKLLAALIAISTGVQDPAALGVPTDVGHKLLECYGDPGGA